MFGHYKWWEFRRRRRMKKRIRATKFYRSQGYPLDVALQMAKQDEKH